MVFAVSEKTLVFIIVVITPMLVVFLWHLAEYIVCNIGEIAHKLSIILLLLLTPVVIMFSLIAYGFKGAHIRQRVKILWA